MSFSPMGSAPRPSRSRSSWPLLLLLFSVIGVPCPQADESREVELPRVEPAHVGLESDLGSRISDRVEGLIRDRELAGAVVLVARRGKIAHLKAYGQQNLTPERPLKPDTIFRIFSMTKPVVSVAVMMLEEQGKLGLDDPVSRHLPALKDLEVYHPEGPKAAPREMTIRDLLRHTSGITYSFQGGPVGQLYAEANLPDRKQSLEEFIAKLARLPLAHAPGEKWTYSLSTDVLGRVVEVASGKTLDVFLRERIFEPLDMRDTGFHVPPEKASRLADQFRTKPGGGLEVSEPASTSPLLEVPTFLSGGGGLVSTARDYAHFLQMLMDGGQLAGKRLLREETVKRMTRDQLPASIPAISFGSEVRDGLGFGLGFNVCTKPSKFDPACAPGEYGWGGAASTHFWVSPRHDLFVITLEQTKPYNWNLERALKQLVYDAVKP